MEDRKARLERSIMDWYGENPDKLQRVRGIVCKNKGEISLRVLEHFVTNYISKNKIVLPNPRAPGDLMDVHSSYKEQLRCFHKVLFDPFCRSSCAGGKRDVSKEKKKKSPSLRQLNFFRWAFRTGVLDYVSEHVDEIVSDMNQAKRDGPEVPSVDVVPAFSASACYCGGPL